MEVRQTRRKEFFLILLIFSFNLHSAFPLLLRNVRVTVVAHTTQVSLFNGNVSLNLTCNVSCKVIQ